MKRELLPREDRMRKRRLKVLRVVARYWYRDQRCYAARVVREMEAWSRLTVRRDIDQLVYDGLLDREDDVITTTGKVDVLSVTDRGWKVLGRVDGLLD